MDKELSYIEPHYQVGGSVRDELLGVIPKDYDFATSLLPDEIEQKIREAGRKPFVTGKRFGTVAFQDKEKGLVEITTFRSEIYEPGSRKPLVTFTKNIDSDLARRDFTINAIARRGDRLIDPFKGQVDLKLKLLKAVGNPAERFNEDPLRLLRLARFVGQLDFDIDLSTHKAAKDRSHKILEVSRERWMLELDKLLMTDYVTEGLQALVSIGLLRFILPELQAAVGFDQHSPYHQYDLWTHTVRVVSQSPKDISIRWAALLHDIGKPSAQTFKKSGQANYVHHEAISAELVYGIAKRLKWSEERRKSVTELVANHYKEDSPLREADKLSH